MRLGITPDGLYRVSGYVCLHRRMIGHPAFRNDAEAMAFAWMTAKAAWRPTRVRYKERLIALGRGQLAVSVRDMATAMDRDKAWVERLWKRLKSETMIEAHVETGVSIITICKYDIYQGDQDRGETPDKTPAKTGARQGRDTEQEGEEGKKGRTPSGGARKTRLPADFEPVLTEAAQATVTQWPPGMFERELAQFKDRATAQAVTYSDWQAGFRTWITNADKWRRQDGAVQSGGRANGRNRDGFGAALTEAINRLEGTDNVG